MHPFFLRGSLSNPRIFHKLIRVEEWHVVVPRKFLNYFKEEVPEDIELEDPFPNTFRFKFYYDQNEARIGPNISELRLVHQIRGDFFIHLTYVGGSKFMVRIFGSNFVEIDYKARGRNVEDEVETGSNFNNDILSGDEGEDSSIDSQNLDEYFSQDENDCTVDHEMLVFTVELTVDLMGGRHHLTIPDYIQLECFCEMNPEINVLLPDRTWRRWQIIWYSLGQGKRGSGMMGEFVGQWFDFYKETFTALGNTVPRHTMQLWKMGIHNSYRVVILTE